MESRTVAVLLAVYSPNEKWLGEQLNSINAQTYPRIKLYVRDDASPDYPVERLRRMVEEHITRFPFTVERNEHNLGSTGTFAALVQDCCEQYVAFCDQDDVWLPQKIDNAVALYETSSLSPTLVCANVSVTDGAGTVIAKRMDKHRRHHVFLRGSGLAPHLIYRNFVMGCTVLMERERALSYLPFPETLVHDHYLAFRAATDGAIDYTDEPQMRYRIHGNNQTGILAGVQTREDYFNRRIKAFDDRIRTLCQYSNLPALQEAAEWSRARIENFHREKGSARKLFRLRRCDRATTWMELIALRLPAPLFRTVLRIIRKIGL